MVIFFKLIASSQSIGSAHLPSDGLPDDTLTAVSFLTSVEDSAHNPLSHDDGSIGSSNHKPPPALLFFSSHASRAQDSAHSPRVQYSDCPDDSLAMPAHSYVISEVFLSSARNSAHFSSVRRDSIDSDVIPQVGHPTTPLNDDSAHHRRSARSVSSSVVELQNIQLDFKKFHEYYDPAKKSMKNLEAFFANYASSVEDQKSDGSVLIKPIKKWEMEESQRLSATAG